MQHPIFLRGKYEFFKRNVVKKMKSVIQKGIGFIVFHVNMLLGCVIPLQAFEVKDKILECFMYITVVGLGVTSEKFGKK